MRTLQWFESELWLQRLQSCKPPRGRQPVTIYPFPMDEILFQILRRAKLEEPWEVYSHLHALWTYYCSEHPEFTLTIEELTAAGWLDNFCGRWSLIGYVKQEHIDSAEDRELKAVLRFLLWLQEQIPTECSAVYLDNWEGILSDLRGRYPKLPETGWFIQQHVLCEDQRHLCRFPYAFDRHHVHMALARLLLQQQTEEGRAQWAEIAHQLQATEKLMDYIPRKEQGEVVRLMTDRVLSGILPRAREESLRICRQNMLERRAPIKEINRADILSDDDSIQNIVRAEREYWEWFPWFWHRSVWRSFELAIVIEHNRSIPEDKLDALLTRLEYLHSLGILELQAPSPEACLELLRYPQTQFCSLQTLAKLHREQSARSGNSAGDCILAWLSFALQQLHPKDGKPIAQLLLYLTEHAYRRTPCTRSDAQLLQASLQELSRFYFTKTELLTSVTEQVIKALDGAKGVVWCERFQLLCDLAEHLHQTIPAERRPTSQLLMQIYARLGKDLDILLNTPFCSKAVHVPTSIFEQSYWPDLYESMDLTQRQRMTRCVVCWYNGRQPTNQKKFDARYQFRLGLGWLTALVRKFDANWQLLHAFGEFLLYVLDEKNQLLTIEYHGSAADHGELARAIGTLRRDQVGISQFLHKAQTLRVAELVLLVQYSEDESLRAFYLELLEEKIREGQTCMEQFGWDKLVEYILKQKIAPLYLVCEARLEEHLAYGRERNLHHSVFDQDWRQLSYLWLLQGNYERILSEGHPYIQAAVYLEEGEHQDLDRAITHWSALAEKEQEPSAYLNWMLAYLYQLDRTPKGDEAGRRIICRNIEELRLKIEKGPFLSWEEDAQLHYAGELIAIWTEQGQDECHAIKLAAQTLSLSEEKVSELWREKNHNTVAPEMPIQLAPAFPATNEQLVQTLTLFRDLSLESKSRIYFSCRSPARSEQYGTSLVLLEVFRTLYHLSNFGDKLLFGQTLDEDHCTQLFREMFNLNGGEWWKLTANDQQQSGSTGKLSKAQLHRSAENDLLIKAENYTYMILEAMVLDHWNKKSVERHLLKLIGDNIHNVPMVLLIYGNSTAPLKLWDQLNMYLTHDFPVTAKNEGIGLKPFSNLSDSEFYLPNEYAPLQELARHSVISYASHDGSENMPLIVICADIGKRKHTSVSLTARSDPHQA